VKTRAQSELKASIRFTLTQYRNQFLSRKYSRRLCLPTRSISYPYWIRIHSLWVLR